MNIKNLKIFLIIGTLLLILIVIIHLANRQQTQPLILSSPLTNYDQTITTFSNINYSGPLINTPSNLSIASATFDPNEAVEILDRLITKYNFETIVENSFWNNYDSSIELSRNEHRNCYILLFNDRLPNLEYGDWHTQTLASSARQFINENLGHTSLEPQIEHLSYYLGEFHIEPTTAEESNIVVIPFAETLEGIPIIYDTHSNFPFVVFFNNQNLPFRLEYCPQFITPEIVDVLPSISVQQAMFNINNLPGSTSIIDTEGIPMFDFDPSAFVRGNLIFGSLQYRFNRQTGMLMPMYSFSGVLYDQHGNSTIVNLITPAVQVAFE
ncbi:MAG: hypothetical protein LBG64_00065 [Pseudomonadales bacterium]|jgi:hypothetical protein|nr:hypothetical protein [Pseudomonadales bacterium]